MGVFVTSGYQPFTIEMRERAFWIAVDEEKADPDPLWVGSGMRGSSVVRVAIPAPGQPGGSIGLDHQ